MKKHYYIILLAIVAIIIIILGVRFFSGEDNWVCQNGEWAKHENPNSPKPETKCEEKFIVGNYWVCRDGEWIKFGNPSAEKPVGNCEKVIENEPISEENQSQTVEEANIIVSSPEKNAIVSSPFFVEGKARVFEDVVSIKLEDKNGKILFQGTTDAQSPDMGQYGLFKKEIKYTTSQTEGTLKVFESSAKDGSEINEVIIPVKLRNK